MGTAKCSNPLPRGPTALAAPHSWPRAGRRSLAGCEAEIGGPRIPRWSRCSPPSPRARDLRGRCILCDSRPCDLALGQRELDSVPSPALPQRCLVRMCIARGWLGRIAHRLRSGLILLRRLIDPSCPDSGPDARSQSECYLVRRSSTGYGRDSTRNLRPVVPTPQPVVVGMIGTAGMDERPAKMMSFTDAFRTCMVTKYFAFQGRASRSEFWWFQLGLLGISILAGFPG